MTIAAEKEGESMRYYIKAGLQVKLGDIALLPCSIDLQLGAVLADEETADRWNPLGLVDDNRIMLQEIPGGQTLN